jgi:uncharacterized membrane protein
MGALGRVDPFLAQRAEEVALFDGRFGQLRLATLAHVIPGGLFLLLAPLQFSSRVRKRYRSLHRWNGRLLVVAALTSAVPALYFGLVMPFGGLAESIAVAMFGGLFMASVIIAVIAIRTGDVTRHREWMLRAFAVAIAISVVRLISVVVDVVLTPAGVSPRVVFVISIWAGWIATSGVAEAWIVGTRRRGRAADSGSRRLSVTGSNIDTTVVPMLE